MADILPINMRRARREDVPVIVRMLADDFLGRSREQPADPLPSSYDMAFDALDGSDHFLLMVANDADGNVVGCLQLCVMPGLSSQGAPRALIEDVRTDSRLRGHGIGAQMIRWAIDEAQVRGCKLVELFTHHERTDAQRFYIRLGFARSHVGMTLRF